MPDPDDIDIEEDDGPDTSEDDSAEANDQGRKGRPVGNGEYSVRQGECMASIAADKGFFWKTLWELAENRELRTARKDPNVLLAGDRVHVPPLRAKQVAAETDKKHSFIRKGEPSIFRVTIMGYDRPRAGEPYRLQVDGGSFRSGNLDNNGTLETGIPGNAKAAVLWVGVPPYQDRYDIELGALDPVDEPTGIRDRLENLGFDCGGESGTIGPLTRAALANFQKHHGLPVTGDPDAPTLQRLESEHACGA